MKKQTRVIGIWAVCTAAALCGCSQNEELDEANQLVDLCIHTSSITLTRATTSTKVITSDYFDANSVIAVYAHSSNTNKTSNNNAKFKCTSASSSSINTWGYNDGSDKIQLSAEVATIYAVYPDGLTVTTSSEITGDNLKAGGVQVFVGSDSDNDENSRIVADASYTSDTPTILAAPGETDYMYATDGASGAQANAQPKANNGKSSDTSTGKNPGNSISLQMNHAMAMVSFKVYNDGTYTHKGELTKIQLTNADTGTSLQLGAMTMNISNGAIEAAATPTADAPTAITRYIYTKGDGNNTAGYELHKSTSGGTTAPDNNPAFSMLVYPITSAITQNSIKAIFTVDGNDYPVTIPAESSQIWAAGNNYIYTVKLNGKELAITNVTINEWTDQTISGELIPVPKEGSK